MKEEAANDAVLRHFLLGRVEDEERLRIESLFLTDPQTRETVLAAEQELIDDYLEDRLSPADRDTFLSLYGDTAAQRRKLRIAKSIQQWAEDQANPQPAKPEPSPSAWRRLLERLRARPVIVIPLAVAATAAIVLALIWINTRANEQREYLAMQRELAQLNTPANLRDVPPGLSQLILKPGSVRSVEAESVLTKRPDTSQVELRLLWTQKDHYSTYEAILHRPGSDRPNTISSLTAEQDNGIIRVRLPAQSLTRGDYQIELKGVSSDGSRGASEVYTFTVSQ